MVSINVRASISLYRIPTCHMILYEHLVCEPRMAMHSKCSEGKKSARQRVNEQTEEGRLKHLSVHVRLGLGTFHSMQ